MDDEPTTGDATTDDKAPHDAADRICIPLSRTKLVLGLVGAVLFVGLSIVLWIAGEGPGWLGWIVGGRLRFVAVIGASFFGLCAVYGAVKLFDRKPGLIIDRQGLIDNSSAVAAGRIPWDEITGYRAWSTHRQRMLVIDVVDPRKYQARGWRGRQWLDSMNTRLTGSPIVISANSLAIGFDKLEQILAAALAIHRGREGE